MRYSLPILLVGLLFANCGNDAEVIIDPAEQLSLDKTQIKDYLTTNGLPIQETASGLHYIIEERGSINFIGENDNVNVLFDGYYLDGGMFDQTGDCSPVTVNLRNVIPGFREGIQLFNVGGKGSIFIPSGLAFGSVNNNGIPANSVLAFDLEIVDQKAFDRAKIQTYLDENSLVADSTLSGIHYKINTLGTGDNPSPDATVTVNYRGTFADGTVFDQSNTPATFDLNQVIRGWKEAIPLLKIGGLGTFLIPSNLAYGEGGRGSIPGNTMLIFEVELLDFRE